MNPVALVTGGTRGIGLGIARSLAGEGYDLALCGMRDEQQVLETINELRVLGGEVQYYRCNVGDRDERTQLLENIRQDYGRLQLLVNNAGMAPAERKDLLEATEDSFAQVMGVNLQGPYFLTQAAANWMIKQLDSEHKSFGYAIINVSSISATVASVNRGEYCVSKAGMSMATQLWAARLGEYGIGVYEVRPGITETDMTAGVKDKYDRLIADGLTVQPRWGQPEDVGKAVVALARGDFAYSTGQVIMVDGGLTIPRL